MNVYLKIVPAVVRPNELQGTTRDVQFKDIITKVSGTSFDIVRRKGVCKISPEFR